MSFFRQSTQNAGLHAANYPSRGMGLPLSASEFTEVANFGRLSHIELRQRTQFNGVLFPQNLTYSSNFFGDRLIFTNCTPNFFISRGEATLRSSTKSAKVAVLAVSALLNWSRYSSSTSCCFLITPHILSHKLALKICFIRPVNVRSSRPPLPRILMIHSLCGHANCNN